MTEWRVHLQTEKVYVQHRMREHKSKLYDLIEGRGGSVYVCGDGASMAKDVHATLVDVFAEGGGLSAADAAARLAELAKEQRYVRDIWS